MATLAQKIILSFNFRTRIRFDFVGLESQAVTSVELGRPNQFLKVTRQLAIADFTSSIKVQVLIDRLKDFFFSFHVCIACDLAIVMFNFFHQCSKELSIYLTHVSLILVKMGVLAKPKKIITYVNARMHLRAPIVKVNTLDEQQ